MDSRARASPQPSTSGERSVASPGERQEESPDEAALCLFAPPRPRSTSVPAAAASGVPEARHPAASGRPAPSGRGPARPRAGLRRGAGAAPGAQPGSPPSRDHGRRAPTDPAQGGRLEAHLRLALGREARLWRGGHPQVPAPRAGASGSTRTPSPSAHAPTCTCAQAPTTAGESLTTRGPLPLQQEIRHAFKEVVLWLLRQDNIFDFSEATINLALTILSRLLVSVKVKERLLECVTITSLRLAAKVHEEDEVIPHVKDFIKHYGSKYTPSELLRMELAILDKLHWDLYIGTPLDFLTIFHALVVLDWPQVMELLPQRNPSLHVESLTRQLQHCMAGHQVLQFKGSTLALVIITLELERLMPDWCTPISDLLKKAQVNIEQFSCCKELVKQQLRSL
ncbi:cyclin-I2 [Talpa occidentalis]|uniref:cyclin-I2 n=1 Tax=Talpa occidentalis TaxID=50954 RepID=UPI00188F057C|nr:cyclin-I2 [Talpa occidentalis]